MTVMDTAFPHGTHAGYARHVYRNEKPCDACRGARRAYERARLEAKRAKGEPTSKSRRRKTVAPAPTEPIAWVDLLLQHCASYVRTSGWRFTCAACGRQTAPYASRDNVETMQREHLPVCPTAPERVASDKPRSAVPFRGRLAGLGASGARTPMPDRGRAR